MDIKKFIELSRDVVRNFPLIRSSISKSYRLIRGVPLIGNYIFKKRWKYERALLRGEDPSVSNKESIIHFTLNRSASQFVKRVLALSAKDEGLLHVDWSKMAGHSEYPYMDHLDREEVKQYSHFFKKKGYLYSHFGGYVEGIKDISDYKVLLVVRDPRDLVVSNYFSTLHSHILPVSDKKRIKFIKERKLAKEKDVNEWVKEKAERYKSRFEEYRTVLLEDHKDVHVEKFEDMISNFDTFLERVLDYCELKISNSTKQSVLSLMEKRRPKNENKKSRNRKGKSGDYKNKLDDSTIEYLNKVFKEDLEYFNY